MEEGRLTDAQGRIASFSETVIILTSNMGSEYLDQPVMTDEMRDQVMAVTRSTLRPEFLNRLDEVIMFLPLTPEQLRQILDLLLKKEVKLLAAQGVTLEISEAAIVVDAGAERSPGMGRAARCAASSRRTCASRWPTGCSPPRRPRAPRWRWTRARAGWCSAIDPGIKHGREPVSAVHERLRRHEYTNAAGGEPRIRGFMRGRRGPDELTSVNPDSCPG